MKFLSLNYNTSVITYGPRGTGKTHIFLEILRNSINAIISEFEGQALFFVEAYEMYHDSKSNQEKRSVLIKVPQVEGKHFTCQIYLSTVTSKQQLPEIVRFNNLEEFDSLLAMIKQASLNFDDEN